MQKHSTQHHLQKRICKAHVFVHYHRVHTFTYYKMGGLKELPVFNLIY